LANQEVARSRSLLNQRLNVFEWEPPLLHDHPARAQELIEQTLATGSFQIALQPIVHLQSAEVVAYEALARFPDSELGPPGAWFAAAARLRLLKALETAALRKGLALLQDLPEETSLAVNLSPEGLIQEAGAVLQGLDRTRVIVELTEHEPVADYGRLADAVSPLREAGVRLAVDDTGAGFASLRPQIIKIDIDIIRWIDADPGRRAIAEMLVRFAERVGARVVAEGVETQAEAEVLADLGPMWAQGYYFGRPAIP
jgi:EAL domain-containing protein (putative c-di-GMP-specific phosphodiesterase class I)